VGALTQGIGLGFVDGVDVPVLDEVCVILLFASWLVR
jgi:hypothetical protein